MTVRSTPKIENAKKSFVNGMMECVFTSVTQRIK